MDQAQDSLHCFSGSIDQIRLSDLVQLECLSQMSQDILVNSSFGSGTILIRSGHAVHAALQAYQGDAALVAMLRWKGGTFETQPPSNDETVTITKNWESLIVEALRPRPEGAELIPAGGGEQSATGFSGQLNGIQLTDLVQLACMARTHHLLEIESERGKGTVVVEGGQVIHAATEELQGEEAFFDLFRANGGTFAALPPPDGGETTIGKPWEYLLIEAMRVLDERSGKGDEAEDAAQESLFQRMQKMRISEKVRLAMTGDKEVRGLLIRETNRLIQFAIVSNPRITDGEIVAISSSRHIDEEILRKIAGTREWLKLYAVRLALVKNPKTPLPMANRLVQTLQDQDLKQLAKSKAVPTAVAATARRIVTQKLS